MNLAKASLGKAVFHLGNTAPVALNSGAAALTSEGTGKRYGSGRCLHVSLEQDNDKLRMDPRDTYVPGDLPMTTDHSLLLSASLGLKG